ncbi:MAG: flagellar protein FlaG [Treponema sp.]|nr:flagellar protein FlaG [Treponema sp.]
MNAMSMIGQTVAMDGRAIYSAQVLPTAKRSWVPVQNGPFPDSSAEVAQNIAQRLSETKANVQELQKLSDMVMGHKLQFNVNEQLGRVVVKVIDSSTNEIIREIPSEDVQKLQIRMKQAIGVLFDETI